jgi:hypothetical protein
MTFVNEGLSDRLIRRLSLLKGLPHGGEGAASQVLSARIPSVQRIRQKSRRNR